MTSHGVKMAINRLSAPEPLAVVKAGESNVAEASERADGWTLVTQNPDTLTSFVTVRKVVSGTSFECTLTFSDEIEAADGLRSACESMTALHH